MSFTSPMPSPRGAMNAMTKNTPPYASAPISARGGSSSWPIAQPMTIASANAGNAGYVILFGMMRCSRSMNPTASMTAQNAHSITTTYRSG